MRVVPGWSRTAVFTVLGSFSAMVGGALPVWGGDSVPSPLRLICSSGYLPGHPVLVRLELRRADGSLARGRWDAEAELSADPSGVVLSTNRVQLRNGLGSALVAFSGAGDFTLRAAVGGARASRNLRILTNPPVASVSGTLEGGQTVWSNLVQVTGDVTVPAGHRLTLLPGTLVLMDGVNAGSAAPDLLISGAIEALGTEDDPVTITCSHPNPAFRWGQIRHNAAQTSRYQFTSIIRGGRAGGEGHTGQAPVLRLFNSRVHFESCNLTDYATPGGTPGKVMMASGSALSLNECLLQRARMGPEISGSSFLCTNTWIMDMKGPDDADGVYPHSQGAGQEIRFVGCVFANGDDDGIDTLGAEATIEDCIIRDWPNPNEDAKGISGFNGTIRVRRSLLANCHVGLATKSSSATPARVFLEQCTILGLSTGVLASRKSNATNGVIDIRLTNCIVRAPEALRSDFAATNFSVGYCNLSGPWEGAGNQTDDPLFQDAGAHDYRLSLFSPCIDAGEPASAPDGDGSPADLGALVFVPPPPRLDSPVKGGAGSFMLRLAGYTNRFYTVDVSPDARTWTPWVTQWQTNSPTLFTDPAASGEKQRFYRARLGP